MEQYNFVCIYFFLVGYMVFFFMVFVVGRVDKREFVVIVFFVVGFGLVFQQVIIVSLGLVLFLGYKFDYKYFEIVQVQDVLGVVMFLELEKKLKILSLNVKIKC